MTPVAHEAVAALCLRRCSQYVAWTVQGTRTLDALSSILTGSFDAELIIVIAVLNAHTGAIAFNDAGGSVVGAHPAIRLGYGNLACSSAKWG
jgi:hypothetical protein